MKALSLFLAVATIWPLLGDTVELEDGTSVNGRVTFDGTTFKLRARFPGQKEAKDSDLVANEIKTIRFNSVDFNPGPPPLNFRGSKAAPVKVQVKSHAVLTKGKDIDGFLEKITDQQVHIQGKEITPRREIVSLRVEVVEKK